MSGTLFVVATPIGNLEDITLRALRVLREADVIAAEDTRRTAKLLAHYSITTPTLSFHAHNTRTRVPQLLGRLEAGKAVALVTDAGTPGISDPGTELIQACWDKEIPVDPIPGASAPLAAAVASGFRLDPLTIYGFVPARSKDRKTWMARLQTVNETLTFFETPHRIQRTLAEIPNYFGNRPILIARELTKRHQELIRYDNAAVIGRMPEPQGEFTLVIGPRRVEQTVADPDDSPLIYRDFCLMTERGAMGRREIVSVLAQKYGRSAKDVYGIVERLKTSMIDPS
jgi:16S rRNA (cytidine1402-2'-O)-methyltransferase